MKKPPPDTFIALLRGINVGGHNMVPMAELRSLCTECGWSDVESYVQSGNLVFSAIARAAALESQLERSLDKCFGFSVPVIVRTAAEWSTYIKANPFPKESAKEPNLVMLALSKSPPKPDAVESLRERAAGGERVEWAGNALWIHFKNGVARSKLAPSLLDRSVGSLVTTRNWRTVINLDELARRDEHPA